MAGGIKQSEFLPSLRILTKLFPVVGKLPDLPIVAIFLLLT